MSRRSIASLAALISVTFAGVALAWDDAEHRILAKRAYEQVLAEWPAPVPNMISPDSFATLVVLSARDDKRIDRYHRRGRTVYEQLQPLTVELLSDFISGRVTDPPRFNVVSSYLMYHLAALHSATKSTDGNLRRALELEAIAIGYLADAFSSAHILSPVPHSLAWFQRRNIHEAHNFYRTHGAFVVNGAGDAWQTFGDAMLLWYEPSYRRVLDACESSLRELVISTIIKDYHTRLPAGPLATWAHEHNVALGYGHLESNNVGSLAQGWLGRLSGGWRYYETRTLHALMKIPMPVSAAWSTIDEFGKRRHFPQQLGKFHDPGLEGQERRLLYRPAAVPIWMTPKSFGSGSAPAEVLRNDPNVASVRYHQEWDYGPAYQGLLLMTGAGATTEDGNANVWSAAAGYGWDANVPLTRPIRASLELEYLFRFGNSERRAISPRATLGLGLPETVPVLEALHIEFGWAWETGNVFDDSGPKWGVGFATQSLRIPGTYAGIGLRATYERFWVEDNIDRFALQAVFQ